MTWTANARARGRLARLLIVPCLLAWLGCSDVTEPVHPVDAKEAAVAQVLPRETAEEIEDALDRVIPAMSDEAGSKGLEAALRVLLGALTRGESAAAVNSVEAADRALNAFGRGVGPADGDAVHLDVIALALASVRARVEQK